MFAAVLENLHQALVYKECPDPVAKAGEVIVQLKAAALNHRDLWIQKGLYPGIKVPSILGSDGAGVVKALGEGVAEDWLGKEVIINPSHDWGDNEEFYGPDHKILGLPDNGTFAEYVSVKAKYLHEKPAHLSFEAAAALPMSGLTAWRALVSRSHVAADDKVLVTGAGGGVALVAFQFALALGCEVWVTSGDGHKIDQLVKMGAKGGVNYKTPTWYRDLLVKAQASKHGYFNVIIDSAGGPGFARLIDVATPGARICSYGGGSGNITDLVPAKIFFKQLNILGTMVGTEREFTDMMDFVGEKKLVPVVDQIFDLKDAENAMRYMDSGKQFGKIILKIG